MINIEIVSQTISLSCSSQIALFPYFQGQFRLYFPCENQSKHFSFIKLTFSTSNHGVTMSISSIYRCLSFALISVTICSLDCFIHKHWNRLSHSFSIVINYSHIVPISEKCCSYLQIHFFYLWCQKNVVPISGKYCSYLQVVVPISIVLVLISNLQQGEKRTLTLRGRYTLVYRFRTLSLFFSATGRHWKTYSLEKLYFDFQIQSFISFFSVRRGHWTSHSLEKIYFDFQIWSSISLFLRQGETATLILWGRYTYVFRFRALFVFLCDKVDTANFTLWRRYTLIIRFRAFSLLL